MRMHFSKYSIAAVAYFLILAVLSVAFVLSGRVSITTDFMSMIPTYGIPEGVSKAEGQFVAKQNGSANILFGHEDFEVARAAAVEFHERMDGTGVFDELSLSSTGSFDMSEVSRMLDGYRYALLPESVQEEILESPGQFQMNSLAAIYSPFSLASLDSLDRDPFLVDSAIVTDLAEKASSISPVMPKEGVLATQYEGMWYVLLQGALSQESLDITNTDGGVGVIYEVGDDIASSTPGLSVSYSGFPFHSFESASNAQKEIAIITGISILLIVVMFLILLRNVHVIGLFLLGIAFSLGAAFASLCVFFKDIHILTMIFGTSLIGTSIDYSIHYYLAYARREKGEDSFSITRLLSKNLAVSFASTVLCYALIVFSPYDILRQVGVFSFFGLLGSFLVVMGIFPLLIRPGMVNEKALAWRLKPMPEHRSFLLPLVVVSLCMLAFTAKDLHVRNSVADLYQMSDRLLESEITVGSVMGFMSSNYAIVEGVDEADARENEYEFSRRLAQLQDEGLVGGYLSPSLFIPPPSSQLRSLEVARSLRPLLQDQCDRLGIDSTAAMSELDDAKGILYFDDLPASLGDLLGQLIAGRIDDRYYIVVMIFDIDPSVDMKSIAASYDGVTYFQKVDDINHQLDELTMILLKIFVIAFVIIIVLTIAVFRKKGLKLAMSPVVIVAVLLSSMPLLGQDLDFFFAVGMLLVIGLGLDYMVFAGNSEHSPIFAIAMCYVTTALSFGTLALSSFRPVHIFGVTVMIGITTAFICALCAERRER